MGKIYLAHFPRGLTASQTQVESVDSTNAGTEDNVLSSTFMQTHLSPTHPESGKLSYAQIEERIRARAYELYEELGQRENHALDDWLEAKAEVLGVVKKP